MKWVTALLLLISLLAGCGSHPKRYGFVPSPYPNTTLRPGTFSPPTITGTASQGSTLTESHGVWSGSPTSYTIQWEDCNGAGASCSNIAGATGATYVVGAGDVGFTIRVSETASNAHGTSSAVASAPTSIVGGTGGSSTGASQAVCSPTACGNGTMPTNSANLVCADPASSVFCTAATTYTTALAVNSVTGATNCTPVDSGNCETRSYGYYIPSNLVYGSSALSTQRPAAVFEWPRTGCQNNSAGTEFGNSQLKPYVNADKMIVIFLLCYTPAGSSPRHPEIDCGGAGGVLGAGTCDQYTPGVTATDEFYVKAAVNDAIARFNLDPKRLYEIGGSANANMVRDTMCSTATTPANGSLFRAVSTMGGGANALYGRTTGTCANTAKSVFWFEVMGDSDTSDPSNTIPCVGSPCSHAILGFADTRDWWANGYLGNCAAPATSTTGTGGILTTIYDYTCTDGNATSPFFQAAEVKNGGHMWCFLDQPNSLDAGVSPQNCTNTSNNTGGWSTASQMMSFFVGTTTSP